jgi:replication factor C small subunit
MFDASQNGLQFPQPLSEKYRPQTIGEFIGLEKPRKVMSAFAKRPSACAWLFTGPSGVGKSSLALALAKELRADFHHIPSQRCTAESINDTVRLCWYVPINGTFHLVLVDEADRMTPAAQLALLSKLDSTDPPPNTVFVFTCNGTKGLEDRFLSRCRVLEFSSYGMRDALAQFLARVWALETNGAQGPDFQRIAKESTNNVRDALNTLEVELLTQYGAA